MHTSPATLLLIAFSSVGAVCAAQTPSAQTHTPASPTGAAVHSAPTAPVVAPPSSALQPSLDGVRQATMVIKTERWKKGTVRDEADHNLNAIQHDLVETLPALLKEADTAPSSLSKVLPVSSNVDALYDVVVHVFEEARVSAPGEQAAQLQQAMDALEKARVALGLRIQDQAAAEERQIGNMRTAMQAQSASLQVMQAALGIPSCPAPPPVVKKPRPKRVTPAKPAAAGATQTKPAAGATQAKPAAGTATPKPQ